MYFHKVSKNFKCKALKDKFINKTLNFPLKPFFCSYKTPFFALYQLLGAGIFHKKVILFNLIYSIYIPALYFQFLIVIKC